MPGTSIPAMSSHYGTQDVSGLQESTYSPIDEQLLAATSTHINTKEQPKIVELEYQPQREYTLEQIKVVLEILKVFPDAPIMVEVARCESGLDPSADRQNLGVDVGVFQINQVHKAELNRLGLDKWDLHDNLAYARILYDQSGLGPWYMSKHCWS